MVKLALLLVGLAAAGHSPCVAPRAPSSPLARALLPRVIVEAGSGPVLRVWLSWDIGTTGRRKRAARPRFHRWESTQASPLDEAEAEAQAMAAASRCP